MRSIKEYCLNIIIKYLLKDDNLASISVPQYEPHISFNNIYHFIMFSPGTQVLLTLVCPTLGQ